MAANSEHMCVLLPLLDGDHWALPQTCLAEIHTVPAGPESAPPVEVSWRERLIPVLQAVQDPEVASWRDAHSGTGLVAVVPGLKDGGCEYWAVPIRGEGLRVSALSVEQLEDEPESVRDYASAAFRFGGTVYQVPDLKRLQQELSDGLAA